ncbi:two-component sensor histidine kinase [Streptomyces dioscori]|uniref:histidine kinase n=1 Tax=Streptomyces dioscori TaxID=2109333 RepID=A0A2P8Q911_9ACTN|nr:sensor histidine kinase [Streptomyces dioscori]PSM42734.1 two-component sensor histidine kinase [Streptomyces dioscori]
MTSVDRLTASLRRLSPRSVDLLVVAGVAWVTGLDAWSNEPDYRQADWFTWLLLAISLPALFWRRRWPVAATLVTGAACAGWALYGHIGELLNLPVIVALYTVAVQGDRPRTLRTALIASLVSGAVALRVGNDVVNPQGLAVLEMLWPLVPLLLGEVVRTRRQLQTEYAARAARAEEDREREAARRVHEERLRIARELHDVVAHTVTAMTVQAGVALDAYDVRPEVARAAMRQVREAGKEAVRELRATVTVLREPAGDPAEPAPAIGRLDELIDRFAGGGVEIALRREGEWEGVSPVVGLVAYRIVQEALTNVARHSGARRAAVSVVRVDGRLTVEVVDDGSPAPPPAGGGFGLVGMRERATAAGGTIDYGPVPGGGFRVRAELPALGGEGGEGP